MKSKRTRLRLGYNLATIGKLGLAHTGTMDSRVWTCAQAKHAHLLSRVGIGKSYLDNWSPYPS